jgi:glycosyltransferase involved in cell wall biosynthesis
VTPPRVTVVLIAYEAERLVGRAIGDVLRQTLSSLELVVVDDGSRDGTAAAARAAAAGDPRVVVVSQANGGPASARNRGIREARGELVAFLDHDDRWAPRKLEAQVAALDRDRAGLAWCRSALVDEDGLLLGWRLGGKASGHAYERLLECDMVSGGSVAVVRRSALVAEGGFDESLPMRSDWDLWLRLARHHRVVSVPETLVGYTRSGGGLTGNAARMAAAGDAVLAKAAAADPSLDAERLRFLRARDRFALACFAVFDEDAAGGWRQLRRSLALTPAPVLRSPRRLSVVAALVLLTVLPRHAYRAVLGVGTRVAFGLRPGESFSSRA